MSILKKTVFIIIFICLASQLYSKNLERIPLDSNIYNNDDYIYIENGEVPNFFSRPYSYNQSYNPINYKGHFLNPILGLSVRFQNINTEIPYELESYWYNRWIENKPLINLGFQAGMDNFFIHTQFDIRFDYFGGFNGDTFINIPYKDYWYQDFDFNFPTRGYITFGNKDLQLLIGRDKLKFGPGQKTNLMISNESAFFNQLSLTYQSKKFKSTFFFIPLESYLSASEKSELEELINTSDLIPVGNFGKDLTDQSKYLTGHRFEFKPLKNLLLSFTDMLLVGGRFPNFEDIPPTMFYHNVYGENYSNVMIGFDFFWTVINGLGIYGEFIIDDIRNNFETEYSVPTSFGVLAGLRYNIPLVKGRLVFSFEGAYTDPFTYKRWHPYMAFYSRRKLISTSVTENRYLDSPIGFFLGSDSMYISAWINYIWRNKLDLSLGWEYWDSGVNNNIIGEELIISYAETSSDINNVTNLIYLESCFQITEKVSIDLKERLLINSDLLNVISLSVNISF